MVCYGNNKTIVEEHIHLRPWTFLYPSNTIEVLP